jgi:hypothetical protein
VVRTYDTKVSAMGVVSNALCGVACCGIPKTSN